jgi:hypothetical protein
MKNFLCILLMLLFFSCSSNNNKAAVTDSANAIEQHPLQDTNVTPVPDGYAPPNTKVDSSRNKEDSVNASKH